MSFVQGLSVLWNKYSMSLNVSFILRTLCPLYPLYPLYTLIVKDFASLTEVLFPISRLTDEMEDFDYLALYCRCRNHEESLSLSEMSKLMPCGACVQVVLCMKVVRSH